MENLTPPAGFKPYCLDNSFNDVISPLYINAETEYPTIGMFVLKKHCNFGGFAHGGCLMTLLDIALCGAATHALGHYTSTPTVNFSFDFISSAFEGEWIQVEILSVNLTRTMGFVNAMVTSPKGNVVRASGSFKLPKNINDYPSMPVDEYLKWRTGETEQ